MYVYQQDARGASSINNHVVYQHTSLFLCQFGYSGGHPALSEENRELVGFSVPLLLGPCPSVLLQVFLPL